MATKDKAESLVEHAAVEASEQIADRVPGVEPAEARDFAQTGLADLKRVTRAQPLLAVSAALCVGYLFRTLSR